MPEPQRSFMDRVLVNYEDLESIDRAVRDWHHGGDESPLHEFLGFQWNEYRAWVVRPDALPAIVESRRAGVSLSEILDQARHLSPAELLSTYDLTPAELVSLAEWVAAGETKS